jgi:hypothetical protein
MEVVVFSHNRPTSLLVGYLHKATNPTAVGSNPKCPQSTEISHYLRDQHISRSVPFETLIAGDQYRQYSPRELI